ncbi:MAG: type II toxin-antitoxin system VapC family toxin [Fibromonadaceae bacterium]|jgi:PIN domain nuclease of toxin-antitoxin system|nr:type II toxin-antitoxin system VapC family toxin [Fibromonadaceae bacterium]
MRYLIDTNILLFYIWEDDRLSKEVFDLLWDNSNIINISSRSIEEIICLLRIGKIKISRWKETKDIFNHINELGFSIDYFKKEHILTLGKLAPIPDHKDPVDHAIMAHAITNKTTLISSDSKMRFYQNQGLNFIWNKV